MTNTQNSGFTTPAGIDEASREQGGETASNGTRNSDLRQEHVDPSRHLASPLGASAASARTPRRSLFRC
jgi:hypothetical protein